LSFSWWQYHEADTYNGSVEILNSDQQKSSFKVPDDVKKGETIHVICDVTDNGSPKLTRYQRVIISIE
jgi:hypothetical protein